MEPSSEQILALADQLKLLAQDVVKAEDPKAKKLQTANLVMQAKNLIWQVQDPFDHAMDQVVNGFSIGACLALLDIGVFNAIPFPGTATLDEIARKTDSAPELITRLMRQMTSVNVFGEPSLGVFAHNRLSVGLSDHFGPGGRLFYKVAMDEMLPPMLALNKHLAQHGRHAVLHTYTETPHSRYNSMSGKNFWEVLASSPERINQFMDGLSMWAALHPVVAMFPFDEKLLDGNSPDRTLAVDVGGGRGGAMLALRKGCPNLKGELILQDQQFVLNEIKAEELPGVTKMVHDFFTEQPVKNAQVYYIRRVMHDWQDEDCARILKAIVPAMGKDSRILISDMALPEPSTPIEAHSIWLDLMMLEIGGKERTKGDWQKLADISGLKLVNVWQEPEKTGALCVVEYVLPDVIEDHIISGETNTMADKEMTTPKAESTADGLAPAPSMGLDGTTEQREVDWDERTVVGDRGQSVEPGIGS